MYCIVLGGGVFIMKRIVTIQDISCVGKCSLTVALPVISAMGVETAILPTAVLSTHTMFSGFTVKDLTDQIVPIAEHWKKENFTFDAIYTGYLGSFEQIEIVSKLEDAADLFDQVLFDGDVCFLGISQFQLDKSYHTIVHYPNELRGNAFIHHSHSFDFNASDSIGFDEYLVGDRRGAHDTPSRSVVMQLLGVQFSAFGYHFLELFLCISHNLTDDLQS